MALASAAGSLLRERLAIRSRHFRQRLDAVRSLAALRKLPHDDSLQNVFAERHSEHTIVERHQIACLLARFHIEDRKLLYRSEERVKQGRFCKVDTKLINSTLGSSKQIEVVDTQICRNSELVDQGILGIFLFRINIAT